MNADEIDEAAARSAEKDCIHGHPSGTIETPAGGHPPVAPGDGSEDEVLPVPPAGLTAEAVAEMNLREVLTNYRDHDGLGWPAMFAYLRTYDAHRIADLTASVAREGFKEPICLGPGVVLDGLHRLAVAEALDWRTLPVMHADPDDPSYMRLPPTQTPSDGAA